MSDLNIKELRFETHEIGEYIKATKAIFIWEFNLDDKKNKIELQHSRVKGKRTIILNGIELTSGWQYTYNYSYSFPMDKHYITVYQMTPNLYDLRIDNMSFYTLLNRQKMNITNKTKVTTTASGWCLDNNSKKHDKVDNFFSGTGNDNDFDFSSKENQNKKEGVDEFDKNISNEFVFEGDKSNSKGMKISSNPIVAKQQMQMNRKLNENKSEENTNNDLLDLGINNTNTNTNINTNVNNDLFDMFGSATSNTNTKTEQQQSINSWDFFQQPNQSQPQQQSKQSGQTDLFDFNFNFNSNKQN